MSNMKLYSVSDRYIKYLRSDTKLSTVFDNKEDVRVHTRKYLGIVFTQGKYNYYIPFSSPKNADYIFKTGEEPIIRASIIPIIRMTTRDTDTGKMELKGTLKLSNMIPVPSSELVPYSIPDEQDLNYKQIVTKEYSFIKANAGMIQKNARILYNQKTKSNIYYKDKPAPKYLKDTVDFKYAEHKCEQFMLREHRKSFNKER